MSTNRFLTLINNVRTLVEAITTSAGAGDANKIVATGSNGRLDESLLPTGIGADTAAVEASETLAAGDFVNIHNDVGPRVRKADASDPARLAHGFVRSSFLAAATATVYFEGRNDAVSGLTPGATYALDGATPGGVVLLENAADSSGNIIQIVGTAVSATEIDCEIDPPIVIE